MLNLMYLCIYLSFIYFFLQIAFNHINFDWTQTVVGQICKFPHSRKKKVLQSPTWFYKTTQEALSIDPKLDVT